MAVLFVDELFECAFCYEAATFFSTFGADALLTEIMCLARLVQSKILHTRNKIC